MDNEKAYLEHLLSSKASPERAKANREITNSYFWGIFKSNRCTKVLDAGCGVGHFMLAAPRGISIIGIDSNKYVVEHCQKLGLNVSKASVEKTGLEEGTFDGVFCSHVLEHLEKPGEAMKEFRKTLVPGGLLVIRVPSPRFFHTDPTHITKFDLASLRELAGKTGFKNIRAYVYHYPFPFTNWQGQPYGALNAARALPGIREAFDYAVGLKGYPANELVLTAER